MSSDAKIFAKPSTKAAAAKNDAKTDAKIDLKDEVKVEAKKPTNLSASALPTDGHVLCVDRKFKTRYATAAEAMAAAIKLKQTYPVIQAAVYDAAARTYIAVEGEPAKAAGES